MELYRLSNLCGYVALLVLTPEELQLMLYEALKYSKKTEITQLAFFINL